MIELDKESIKVLKQVSDTKDVRDIVRGIHIYASGHAAATDANIAFVTNKLNGKPPAQDYLIEIGTLAMTGIEKFQVNFDSKQLIGLDKHDNTVSYTPFTVLNAEPVDFKNIFDRFEPSTNGEATYDPAYLKAMSVFKAGSQVTFKMGQANSIAIAIGDEGALMIMPQQFRARDLPEILQ